VQRFKKLKQPLKLLIRVRAKSPAGDLLPSYNSYICIFDIHFPNWSNLYLSANMKFMLMINIFYITLFALHPIEFRNFHSEIQQVASFNIFIIGFSTTIIHPLP
jgi:hypothetical protein